MTVVFPLGIMVQRIETSLPLDQLFLTHLPPSDQSPQIGSSKQELEQAVPTADLHPVAHHSLQNATKYNCENKADI